MEENTSTMKKKMISSLVQKYQRNCDWIMKENHKKKFITVKKQKKISIYFDRILAKIKIKQKKVGLKRFYQDLSIAQDLSYLLSLLENLYWKNVTFWKTKRMLGKQNRNISSLSLQKIQNLLRSLKIFEIYNCTGK